MADNAKKKPSTTQSSTKKNVGDNSYSANSSTDALDTTMSMARLKGQLGESGLVKWNGRVYDEAREELRFPANIKTFNKMSYDSTIVSARSVFGMFVRNTNSYFKPKEGQEKNKKAIKNAEFLNWMIDSLEDRSWREVINNVMTYDLYGFSIMEMLFERIKDGDYEGKVRIKDLAPRSQSSVNGWIWSDDGRKLLGFEQRLQCLDGRATVTGSYAPSQSYVKIPFNKCLRFSYNGTKDNPEGNSPLKGCYITWTFKCLLEDYEATGVAKDMSGMPVFGVNEATLVKARQFPESSEAVLVNYLENAAAAMHAGDQNFLIQPIQYDDTGKPLYSFELLGVKGGSKSYNIDDIIKRKQNEILMAYFADVLKLGQDGIGSLALADNKNNLLAHAVQDHLNFIKEVMDRQFIKTVSKYNGGWSYEDTPEFFFDDIEDRDLDELGKFVQRCVSVGAMSTDKDLDADLRKMSNLSKPDYKKPIPSDSVGGGESKAGEGMKTAGEGTSKSVGGKDKSVSNSENASVDKYNKVFNIVSWNNESLTVESPTGRVMTMGYQDFVEFFKG